MSGSLNSVIGSVGDLPSMPVVASKVIELLQASESDVDALAEAIAIDPTVSMRVLKIANSSYYGLQRKVTTIRTAIVVLGEKSLRSLVLAVSLEGLHKRSGEVERLLWEDAFGCAVAARIFGRFVEGVDEEEAFLAGLIRHLGKMIRNNNNPEMFQKVLAEVESEGGAFSEVESGFFREPHAVVGAAILKKWNFPPVLVEATLHHADMAIDPVKNPRVYRLVATLHLAETLCRKLGVGHRRTDNSIQLSTLPLAGELGLSPANLLEIEEEFVSVFFENRDLFFS